jgi:hypothetical protein
MNTSQNTVVFRALDNDAVAGVSLHIKPAASAVWQQVNTVSQDGNEFTFTLPNCARGMASLKLVAEDATGNKLTQHWEPAYFFDIEIQAPSGVAASDGTSSDFVLVTWNPVDGASGYEVYRSLTQAGAKVKAGISAANSLTDTGAVPGATYYYFVTAVFEHGISSYSALDTGFRKLAPTSVQDLAVAFATGSSATLTWTTPGMFGSTAPLASYDIRVSTSPISDANWAAATQVTGEPTPAVPGTKAVFHITGLASGTEYHFALKSVNSSGQASDISNIASATTAAILVLSAKNADTDESFSAIQDACDDADTLSGHTLLLQQTLFDGSLSLTSGKALSLGCGYNSDFSAQTGATCIKGVLSVSSGEIIVSDGEVLLVSTSGTIN